MKSLQKLKMKIAPDLLSFIEESYPFYVCVKINKLPFINGLGFTIKIMKGNKGIGVYINFIILSGAVAETTLEVGDQIISINAVSLLDLNYTENEAKLYNKTLNLLFNHQHQQEVSLVVRKQAAYYHGLYEWL